MDLYTLRPAIQLASCAVLIYRIAPNAPLPLQTVLTLLLYPLIAIFVVLPCRLFIYFPYLSPLRDIPSPPKGLNTWRTWLAAEPTPPQLLHWVEATAHKHGDKFRGVMRYYGIGGGERILLTSSAALREVLVSKQYDYFDRPTIARKRIAVQAGNGLIASGGNDHKNQKRKLIPAFSGRAIKDLHPLFCAKANELVTALHKKTQASGGTTSVEIVTWTSRSALDIIGIATWGTDFKAISEPDSLFLKTYGAMFDISGGGQFVNALALILPMALVLHIPCEYNKRLKTALKSIRSKCMDAVHAKKQKIEAQKAQSNDKDILSLLIKGGVDDDDVLANQMMTMLAAGHDTSSLTLAWACYLLCKHADARRRLKEELRANLPLNEKGFYGEIAAEDLENLQYLNAIANETLRLMPAVPITRRETLKSTEVQGYVIPKDAHMVASGYVANRNESEWGKDAGEFIPDRWLASNDTKDRGTGVNNKFAFHSFSHGPRSCIGQGFARSEFLVFLAALVANFDMELENPDEEVIPLFGITMSPQHGIKIKLNSTI